MTTTPPDYHLSVGLTLGYAWVRCPESLNRVPAAAVVVDWPKVDEDGPLWLSVYCDRCHQLWFWRRTVETIDQPPSIDEMVLGEPAQLVQWMSRFGPTVQEHYGPWTELDDLGCGADG